MRTRVPPPGNVQSTPSTRSATYLECVISSCANHECRVALFWLCIELSGDYLLTCGPFAQYGYRSTKIVDVSADRGVCCTLDPSGPTRTNAERRAFARSISGRARVAGSTASLSASRKPYGTVSFSLGRLGHFNRGTATNADSAARATALRWTNSALSDDVDRDQTESRTKTICGMTTWSQ